MIKRFKKIKEDLGLYSQMTDLASVSRRYFVIGFFDGVLTILGLIVGAHLTGEASARLIISSGIATALALGISSAWGAFEAERIEQKILKDEKERALLVNSRECTIDRAHKFAAYVSSLIHGIAPIIAALLPLTPYVIFPENIAYKYSLAIGLISLFVVGAVIGRIAKYNLIFSGIRMVLAGVITILVILLLSPTHLI